MKIGHHDIGVCSWSLNTSDLSEVATRVSEAGLSHVQLAVSPLANLDDARREQQLKFLKDAGIQVTAGMCAFDGESYESITMIRKTGGFMPPDLWDQRREHAIHCARLMSEAGVNTISTHVGFIPTSLDPSYGSMVEKIGFLAGEYARLGVDLLLETGQEKATELLQFLNDLNARNVGVNFDPANMILYGAGDPVEAVTIIGRHIRHVHVKDAISSKRPGTDWGTEVPFGDGQVPTASFFAALAEAGYRGPLVIERESGDDRLDDIRRAIEVMQQSFPGSAVVSEDLATEPAGPTVADQEAEAADREAEAKDASEAAHQPESPRDARATGSTDTTAVTGADVT